MNLSLNFVRRKKMFTKEDYKLKENDVQITNENFLMFRCGF
jgi:hypothetical protein